MPWLVLVLAGLFEVAWAVGLAWTDGFTKLVPSALVLIASVISAGLLAVAVREIPVGVAYAAWVGFGMVGTAVFGWAWLHEPMPPSRVVFLGMILVGVVGLKFTTPSHDATDEASAR
jgi:quaternary ammonium compound-resistance protein SugE